MRFDMLDYQISIRIVRLRWNRTPFSFLLAGSAQLSTTCITWAWLLRDLDTTGTHSSSSACERRLSSSAFSFISALFVSSQSSTSNIASYSSASLSTPTSIVSDATAFFQSASQWSLRNFSKRSFSVFHVGAATLSKHSAVAFALKRYTISPNLVCFSL